MQKIVWELPLKTVSEANSSEHWAIKSKRHKQQQFFIRALFAQESTETTLPCVITMTRLSTHYLDSDNLQMAFKYLRDQISDCLIPTNIKIYRDRKGKVRELKGRNDSDPRIKWEYAQEKSKRLGVKIEIEEWIQPAATLISNKESPSE